jgi:ribonuclease-3
MFMDGGLDAARAFVLDEFARYVSDLNAIPSIDNPKGELQELLQAASADAPQYQLINATGPDHDRIFECSVSHGGVELARGSGKSKKEAESNAALTAYQSIKQQELGTQAGNAPDGKCES